MSMINSFALIYWVELSPISIPLDCLPKRSHLLLDQSPLFWFNFLIVLVIFFLYMREEVKMVLSSESFDTKTARYAPLSSSFVFRLCGAYVLRNRGLRWSPCLLPAANPGPIAGGPAYSPRSSSGTATGCYPPVRGTSDLGCLPNKDPLFSVSLTQFRRVQA